MKRLDSILLVDDDPISNFISTALIQHLQLTDNIHAVGNGKEALKYLKEHAVLKTSVIYPEVILLDLNMPVMDGFDFLKKFGETMPDLNRVCRIFILTSSESPADIARCNRYDIAGYISKPLDENKLKSTLELVS